MLLCLFSTSLSPHITGSLKGAGLGICISLVTKTGDKLRITVFTRMSKDPRFIPSENGSRLSSLAGSFY